MLAVELAEQIQQLDLVRDVEVGSRFIQQQQRRLLRQRHRHPDALALPAGQLVNAAVRQLADVGGRHGGFHRLFVGLRPLFPAGSGADSGRATPGPPR